MDEETTLGIMNLFIRILCESESKKTEAVCANDNLAKENIILQNFISSSFFWKSIGIIISSKNGITNLIVLNSFTRDVP